MKSSWFLKSRGPRRIDAPGRLRAARVRQRTTALMAAFCCVLISPAAADEVLAEHAAARPPSVLFGEFFSAVALSGLFEDSKQWADAVPKRSPAEILQRAGNVDTSSLDELGRFLARHFDLDPAGPGAVEPTPGLPMLEHIARLWPLLTRRMPEPPPWSSHLPLPHPYVVPGGRFQEIYYWDTYFTMLGFGPAEARLKRDMVENFAHQIRSYGHIPNGNRSYYLSRSQPPFFFRMVELLAPDNPRAAFAEYLNELKAEHAFWMQGSELAREDQPVRRVVYLPDGSRLNRYWDARDVPRDESYREDVEAAKASTRERAALYRDIRAAAESGWDFSSRWLADGESLSTMQTTAIVPIDLNSLLYGLERAIVQGCAASGDADCEQSFEALAEARRAAMHKYLWNADSGLFDDYHWRDRRLLGNVSAATLYPLFVGLATGEQAGQVASTVAEKLLKDGGVVATNRTTGEQWDAPNGWAPLQWIAVTGLRRYDQAPLADTIACRWLSLVSAVFDATGKLLEKYDVVTLTSGGGGEYPLQDGFGWTNGVTVGLLGLYPDAAGVPEHCESDILAPQ